MIEVAFFTRPGGDLLGFHLRGHADADKAGRDVVCAAVSSASYMAVNTVTDILGVSAKIFVDDDQGELLMRVEYKDAHICRDILAGFKLHMLGLEEQYSKNIHVSYTEV